MDLVRMRDSWKRLIAGAACLAYPMLLVGQSESSLVESPAPAGGAVDRSTTLERVEVNDGGTGIDRSVVDVVELGGEEVAMISYGEKRVGAGVARTASRESAAGGAVAEGPLLANAAANSIRQASSYPVPWVEATDWDSANPFSESYFEVRPFKIYSWSLFNGEIDYDRMPGYVVHAPDRPLFEVRPPRETVLARKLKRLARKKMYQEVRRVIKKQWRRTFRSSSTLRYSDYEARMVKINNIGRDPNEFDDLDYGLTDELKADLFQRNYLQGERELPLLTWGPITITDSGSMRFDLGTLKNTSDGEETIVDVGEREKAKRKPFLATRDYRIDTQLKIDVDPRKAYISGEPLNFVDKYGVTVEIDILSDVLGREMVTTEIEFEVDDHREFAGFLNLVIKSR